MSRKEDVRHLQAAINNPKMPKHIKEQAKRSLNMIKNESKIVKDGRAWAENEHRQGRHANAENWVEDASKNERYQNREY